MRLGWLARVTGTACLWGKATVGTRQRAEKKYEIFLSL